MQAAAIGAKDGRCNIRWLPSEYALASGVSMKMNGIN